MKTSLGEGDREDQIPLYFFFHKTRGRETCAREVKGPKSLHGEPCTTLHF